jgi:DNA-binding MarR family transcriptional regulator
VLTTTELTVLDELSSGHTTTVESLAERVGRSREQLYRILDDLSDARLVNESRGSHNRRLIAATNHPVVELYRRLVGQLKHVDWPDLLSPATLRICWFLDEPRRVTEIADRLHVSRQAVHGALSPLKGRAMLSPDGPEYALTDDLQPLLAFARAVVRHEHIDRVRAIAPSATVKWCDPVRAVVRVSESTGSDALESADEWELTGLAAFRQFGLSFHLAGEPAFYDGPTELTAAEAICHTLLLETDTRRVGYSMLLLEQTEIPRATLIDTARWYGLESTADALARVVWGDEATTVSDEVPLPSEREYESLKTQYGVA